MKRLIMAVLLSGFIALLPNPQPVGAEPTKLQACLREAIYTCDEDFDPQSEILVAVRGWCYMIRSAICFTFD